MLDKTGQARVVRWQQARRYMPGFGNDFETEALPGALPQGQNSPQKCNYGLYAEQLSGSPFTAPRGTNERSWLYRIRPSVRHTARFSDASYPHLENGAVPRRSFAAARPAALGPAARHRRKSSNFLAGIRTMTTAGDVMTQVGMAAHVYVFNDDMVDDYFFNADGELLVVPQVGAIRVLHRNGHHRCRALGDLPHPARHDVQGLAAGRRRRLRAAISARTTAPSSPCPTAGRSAPTALPIRATSRRRSRPTRTRKRPAACMSNGAASSTSPRSAIRRSTSSPGTAITRRSNTICAPSRRSARSCSTIPIRRSSRC